MKKYIFISLLTFQTHVKAEKFDRQIISSEVYQLETYNQGNLGICYAVVAATLYSSLLNQENGNLEKIFVSPGILAVYIGLSGYKRQIFKAAKLEDKIFYTIPGIGWATYLGLRMNYASKNLIELIEGGNLNHSLNDLLTHPTPTIHSLEASIIVNGAFGSVKVLISRLYDYIDFFGKQKNVEPDLLTQFLIREKISGNSILADILVELDIFLRFKDLPRKKFSGDRLDKRMILLKFLMRHGGPESGPISATVRENNYFCRERLLRKLENHFQDSSSMPVGFSFNLCNLIGSKKERHAVTVYGKAYLGNKLFFLIRNSWGGKTLREMKESTYILDEQKVVEKTKISGDFWISADRFKSICDWRSTLTHLH